MNAIPFGRDGFVDMDAFPAVDPDQALAPDVYERLHDALVAEPVRVPNESQWEAMLDTALHEPAMMETDWLVPAESPSNELIDNAPLVNEEVGADNGGEAFDDFAWPDQAADDANPYDDDDAGDFDEVDDNDDTWF